MQARDEASNAKKEEGAHEYKIDGGGETGETGKKGEPEDTIKELGL